MKNKLKDWLRPVIKWITNDPDRFLKQVSGLVHVGANLGQERELYHSLGLKVIWIEPIPEIFTRLEENISNFKDQKAVQALVTDVDETTYEFHVASNEGASSSILQLKHHKDIWPEVNYKKTLTIKSTTLATLFKRENIDATNYQALVLDTQGSELLVLRGCLPILSNFNFIKVEVPDFESYERCCQLADVTSFMQQNGYKEFSRKRFARRTGGGNYYDIVFKQTT